VRVSADNAGWLAWNRLRVLCNHHQGLAVALEFPAKVDASDRELLRWLGEPVLFASLSTSSFVENKQGFPVLPRKQKSLLLELFHHPCKVLLSGEGDVGPHLDYVARLFQSRPAPTQAELFGQSHLDCLQSPLQPLQDNLDMGTYRMFEEDPVKYVQYEEAVLRFLQERLAAGRTAPFVVMVVGAGRGPLVTASLQAAQRARTQLAVWAVEKNPNAVRALWHKKRTCDWSCVEVISEDMRVWQAPRKADLLVSELLGSFGDNELSPECLDGAQRFLAEDGASIPQSYTSSLEPVFAGKLWDELRSNHEAKHLDMGYVVNMGRKFCPSVAIQDCFTFAHPNVGLGNDRYAELSFELEADALVHGFIGYFDCILYGDVRISIHPKTFSEGMFSWFPMFIPLREPLFLWKGQVLKSHWWRRHDSSKVWYEWTVSHPVPTPVQNAGGSSWSMALS